MVISMFLTQYYHFSCPEAGEIRPKPQMSRQPTMQKFDPAVSRCIPANHIQCRRRYDIIIELYRPIRMPACNQVYGWFYHPRLHCLVPNRCEKFEEIILRNGIWSNNLVRLKIIKYIIRSKLILIKVVI